MVTLVLVIGTACLVTHVRGRTHGAPMAELRDSSAIGRLGQVQTLPDEKKWQPLKAILMAKPLEPAPGDDAVRKLLKERYNTAVLLFKADLGYYEEGRITLDGLAGPFWKVRDSRLELDESPEDQLVVLELAWEFAKEGEDREKRDLERNIGTGRKVEEARFNRLGAEIQLVRAKDKLRLKQRR
jgi:hypothetical protein